MTVALAVEEPCVTVALAATVYTVSLTPGVSLMAVRSLSVRLDELDENRLD